MMVIYALVIIALVKELIKKKRHSSPPVVTKGTFFYIILDIEVNENDIKKSLNEPYSPAVALKPPHL